MGFSRNNMVVMTMKSPVVVICKRAAQDWAPIHQGCAKYNNRDNSRFMIAGEGKNQLSVV